MGKFIALASVKCSHRLIKYLIASTFCALIYFSKMTEIEFLKR